MSAAAASNSVGWPLAEWLLRHGGMLGALQPRQTAAGRGIFAGAALPGGAVVLAVPPRCRVSSRLAATGPAGSFIAATWSGLLRDHILLAAFLLHARRQNDRHWGPYLDTLPTTLPNHPLFYAPAELDLLRGTGFLSLLAARRERLTQEWELLQRDAPGFSDLTCKEWWLARCLVTSRAFARAGGGAPSLVPIADLLNHSITPEVHWDFQTGSSEFVMHTACAVGTGSELHDSYGPKSNGRLLLHYGFVLAQNPVEECVLELADGTSQVLTADPNDVGPPAEWRSPQADSAQRTKLAELCSQRLRQLAPADECGPDSENARNAVLIRESERRILTQWAQNARTS